MVNSIEPTLTSIEKTGAKKKDEDLISKSKLYLIIGGVLIGASIIIIILVYILIKNSNVFKMRTDSRSSEIEQKCRMYKEVSQNEDRI